MWFVAAESRVRSSSLENIMKHNPFGLQLSVRRGHLLYACLDSENAAANLFENMPGAWKEHQIGTSDLFG